MKRKQHIPVLVLAALFTIVSNGIPIYEHLCKTANSISISLLSSSSCDMEKKVAACCSKKAVTAQNNKGCCEDKSFFKKFSFDGFTAKMLSLESFDLFKYLTSNISIEIHLPYLQNFFTGLSPPYPDYEIAQYLQPTQPGLQVFIC